MKKKKTQTRVTGRLEGWVVDQTYPVVWGRIFGDTKGRFPDGTFIHTSVVTALYEGATLVEGQIIETLNSAYLLGKPFSKPIATNDNTE